MMNIQFLHRRIRTVSLLLCALLMLVSFQASAQQTNRRISGVVTDDTGEPMIGANVVLKGGEAVGCITDLDGKFTLDVPAQGTLVITYMGYDAQEVSIAGREFFNIILKEDAHMLDDVVVVGYGVMKKSDVISSVTSVKAEEMTKAVTLDVGEMLRGKAAGVQITTSYAGPGGGSDIQIRGVNSISGGTSPIVIADGVMVGSINDVNPNDIASVEILKDAAAQAIYGARAANGVVLITTKRGAVGKTSVNYHGYYGVQKVKRNFDVYTPEEFLQYKREAYRTTNNNEYGTDEQVFSTRELESIRNGEFINWQNELMRTGSIQNHDISVTGGTEKTKLFLSANFQQQEGVVLNTDFVKGQFRINVDHEITRWLKVGVNSLMGISDAHDPGMAAILRDAVICSPLGQVYDEEGNLNAHPTGLQENWNPLLDIYEKKLTKKNRYDLVSIFADFTLAKGLSYRLQASRRSWNYKQELYNTARSKAGSYTDTGSGSLITKDSNEWTIDNIFSYDRTFGKHSVSGTFIQSWNEKNEHANTVSASLIPSDVLGVYGLETGEKVQLSMTGYQRRLISTALRMQYNYDSRYYITASARRDGSSVFGADNKWGIFPAMALGWNVYREAFLESFEPLTNLKVRLSYGSVGNEAIDPYGSVASADQWDYYTTGQLSGYTPGATLSNPKLKWETSTTLNTAIDFGFFNNRLSGTFEWYKTNTTNLLVNRSINSSTGYTTIKDNIGEIQNTGVELHIEGVLVKTRDWHIEAGINFSKNNNKIMKLFGDLDGDGKEDDYPANNWFIGKPISVWRTYEAIGIWQESEIDDIPKSAQPNAKPGDVKLRDRDENGVLNDDDRIIVSKLPKWNGSLNLNVEYKGIDFSMDWYTVQGIKKDNPFLSEYEYGGNLRGVFNGIKVDYWTPENPTGKFPRPTTNGANDLAPLARQNASYVRLQNVSIGYSLPRKVLSRLHVNKFRVYVTGQNLLTFTDFQSYSPEQAANEYPAARSVSCGVQVSF